MAPAETAGEAVKEKRTARVRVRGARAVGVRRLIPEPNKSRKVNQTMNPLYDLKAMNETKIKGEINRG